MYAFYVEKNGKPWGYYYANCYIVCALWTWSNSDTNDKSKMESNIVFQIKIKIQNHH